MTSPDIIRNIGDERLEEAKVLLDNGKYDGAFYLAGYSAELYFKAKICENLNIPNLYGPITAPIPNTINFWEGFRDVKKAFKTHNLRHLLILCGLLDEYYMEVRNNRLFLIGGSILFEKWSEHCRYENCGYATQNEANKLINLIDDSEKGLKQWILRN